MPSHGHDWEFSDEGKLAINWTTGSPAPGVVLELLSYKYRRLSGSKLRVPCQCTQMHVCYLQDCSNVRTEVDEWQGQDSSDDEV